MGLMRDLRLHIETELKRHGVRALSPCDVSPGTVGAYLLLITLNRSLRISLRGGTKTGALEPGQYVYAGNAYGPGGLKARVSRHLDKSKKPHWHVDHVTRGASEIKALVFADGNECQLVARLLEAGDFEVPIPGFGSSDCRVCPSHFFLCKERQITRHPPV